MTLGAVIRELRAAPEPRLPQTARLIMFGPGGMEVPGDHRGGEDGAKPAVITILRSGKSKKRNYGTEERH